MARGHLHKSHCVCLFCVWQQSLAFCFKIHRPDAEPTAQSLQTHGAEAIRTGAVKQGIVCLAVEVSWQLARL